MKLLDRSQLYVWERIETAAALTRAGWSAPDIARRLGVTERTIVRYRSLARRRHAA